MAFVQSIGDNQNEEIRYAYKFWQWFRSGEEGRCIDLEGQLPHKCATL